MPSDNFDPDKPIEIVDEDGLAHGYTDVDDEYHGGEREVICNKCGHTWMLDLDAQSCPACGAQDYDEE